MFKGCLKHTDGTVVPQSYPLSVLQELEQPSPLPSFPSSQVSPLSSLLLPQFEEGGGVGATLTQLEGEPEQT